MSLPPLVGDVLAAVWPPLFSTRTAPLVALYLQLERSQWLPAEEIARRQLNQLGLAVAHFSAHVPAFRERLRVGGLLDAPVDAAWLARLPPLRRRDIQGRLDAWRSSFLPPLHDPVEVRHTSGSTGEPVAVARTAVGQLFWAAMSLRLIEWHEGDRLGRLCALRAGVGAPVIALDRWPAPASPLCETGPFLQLANRLDLAEQIARLRAFAPDTLLIYPSNLAALLDRLDAEGGDLPGLRRVRTMAETLHPALRARAEARFGVPLRDGYSSEEFGYIALECPEGGLYHLMAETLIVEIVDAAGAPCRPGEIGRVLVTDLHNLAMPMIRYDIGDQAEAGPPCRCGRGLPTLARIHGRERNMLVTPDGRTAWPMAGLLRFRFRDIAPVAQYQLAQTAPDRIELRLVTERPLSPEEEARLSEGIRAALDYPLDVVLRYYEGALPRGVNGKFEEFVRLF